LKEFLDNTVTASTQMHVTSFWKRTGSCLASISTTENGVWQFFLTKEK